MICGQPPAVMLSPTHAIVTVEALGGAGMTQSGLAT